MSTSTGSSPLAGVVSQSESSQEPGIQFNSMGIKKTRIRKTAPAEGCYIEDIVDGPREKNRVPRAAPEPQNLEGVYRGSMVGRQSGGTVI